MYPIFTKLRTKCLSTTFSQIFFFFMSHLIIWADQLQNIFLIPAYKDKSSTQHKHSVLNSLSLIQFPFIVWTPWRVPQGKFSLNNSPSVRVPGEYQRRKVLPNLWLKRDHSHLCCMQWMQKQISHRPNRWLFPNINVLLITITSL